ncbi:MAG: radical SAM protein, partial [Nitratireductor sp.]
DLDRLRLSSIDSIEADDDLMEALATEPRLMPHLHLSLQSGDDMILKRMKRRHLRDHSIRFCHEVRALRPDAVFGADIIAGFPTETEAMFDNSLKIVAECGLTHLHVFPFSPREGTPAARMPQLDRRIVKDRAARLRAAGEAAYGAHLETLVGSTQKLLIERDGIGRTEGFALAAVAAGAPGEIVSARITGHDGALLKAQFLAEAA